MAAIVRTVSEDGNAVVYLEAGLSGHTSWIPPEGNPNQFVREVSVVSHAGASFGVLTGGAGFSVDQELIGKTLPLGSYQMRLSAITITSGSAILLLS